MDHFKGIDFQILHFQLFPKTRLNENSPEFLSFSLTYDIKAGTYTLGALNKREALTFMSKTFVTKKRAQNSATTDLKPNSF